MSKNVITSIIAAVFALGLLLPATADARKPRRKVAKSAVHKRGAKKKAATKAVPQKFKKETRLEFGDDKVTASAESGAGALVTGERRIKQSSLIKVRANFIPELIKSALDI